MADHDQKHSKSGISRRGFLKGVSVSTVAGAVLHGDPEEAIAQEAARPKGPGEIPVTLNINGQDKHLLLEPRVTLLDALRNRLDLTGSKKVCDRATCGACTVLADGKPVYSCTLLAVEAEGMHITTIEGLGSPRLMNEVQKAFVAHDAQQCGFCTPGFVVACTAFVKEHPNASLEDVRAGLGGNLCRCGTYAGILEASLEVVKNRKGGA